MKVRSKYAAALVFLYLVLVLPDWPGNLVSYTFIRLPVELPLLMLAMIAVPPILSRRLQVFAVATLTIVTTLKIANLVTFEGYARPFNILVDPGLVSTALYTIAAGQGVLAAVSAVLAVAALISSVAVLLWLAVGMLRPDRSPFVLRTAGIGTGVALLAAVPLADVKIGDSWWNLTSWDTSRFAHERALSIIEGLQNDAAFREELAAEGYDAFPADRVLADLRGVDVLLIFVEAYGRAALDEQAVAASVRPALKTFDAALAESGYAARTAWITSPTFGGQSWLAHSTFVTGLWVDNQRRYESLFVSERKTLIHDFARGDWRTVGVMPQITLAWPEGKFFGYDKIYGAADLGYTGPRFDYMTMPDQYTLSAFYARELNHTDRPAVMAEIGLISSHLPWTPLPKFVPWEDVKHGEIFLEERHPRAPINWTDSKLMRANYAEAIVYELETLRLFVTDVVGDNTLLIIVGDHQPIPVVSGDGASYDVPIHIIATNPALLDAIEGWQWTPGMLPDELSPIWRMDGMRRQLLESFTPRAGQVTVSVTP
jgi:hypothetical protein